MTARSDAPCFECGSPAKENHHVVPESLGGTKTVPLCHECHSKVHSMDPVKRMSIATLSREGKARAKAARAARAVVTTSVRNSERLELRKALLQMNRTNRGVAA